PGSHIPLIAYALAPHSGRVRSQKTCAPNRMNSAFHPLPLISQIGSKSKSSSQFQPAARRLLPLSACKCLQISGINKTKLWQSNCVYPYEIESAPGNGLGTGT